MNEHNFFSINSFNGPGAGNQVSSLRYDQLNENKEFYVFFNFRNKTKGTIKNSTAKISYEQYNNEIIFTGRMNGENATGVVGNTFIRNLPVGKWDLKFLTGRIYVDDREGNKGTLCSEAFPELNIPWEKKVINTGKIMISDLPFGKHGDGVHRVTLNYTIN